MPVSDRRSSWAVGAYSVMIAAAVAAFLVIRRAGDDLQAPPADAGGFVGRAISATTADPFWHLLFALAVVMVVGQVVGRLFRRIGQPPVIGEVVGGILLGPSLLGRIAPDAYQFLLPTNVVPLVGSVAELGVILYMFIVGLELEPGFVRGRFRTAVVTAHASIAVPFVLGSALALYLYPRFSTSAVPFTSFALFIGIALSITAFPVLARILSDLGISRSALGSLALTCAAIGDVTAWCLLALVVGVVQANANDALTAAVLTVTFIAVMFAVVGPVLSRWIWRHDEADPTEQAIALMLVGVLVAALTTQAIGVHALFGAFVFGAIVPRDSRFAKVVEHRLESPVTLLLLPAFFAFAGLRTDIGLLSGWHPWLVCGLVIAVATVGKVGGTFTAARLTGLGLRDAAGLGVLMNTRGLMELIVLNVGLQLGVISPTLFTMLVIMALVTTMATTPIVRRLTGSTGATVQQGQRVQGTN